MGHTPEPSNRLVAGVMTGTSIDGIDAAMASCRGPVDAREVALLSHVEHPLGPLVEPLRAFACGGTISAEALGDLATGLGEACAGAVEQAAEACGERPELVVLHGQTVFHAPPRSMAIVDPWPCALRLGCDVLTDLRALDIASGGQGAPITPIADAILFGNGETAVDIVNLGGFCNVTRLDPTATENPVDGFDVCACNQVLDEAARRLLGRPWDDGGSTASGGTPDASLAGRILETSITTPDSRSMGSGDEGFDALTLVQHLAVEDQLATLVEAIAAAIAARIPGSAPIHLFGGGSRNQALVDAIQRHTTDRSVQIGHQSCPIDAREALAMAVLGDRAADGLPITWPALTGARAREGLRPGRWIRA